jgi:hypothetical protein
MNNDITEVIRFLTPTFSLKSKTNFGELSKTQFTVTKTDTMDPALIISRRTLTSNFELYKDFELLKEYKSKRLVQQRFSIKLSTLSKIVEVINNHL